MSCPHCIHCQSEVSKGGLSLVSDQGRINNEEIETPKRPVRGKAREYSQAFELVWKSYPRKEQKFEAFAIWSIRMREVGGEGNLATLILGSLKWQLKSWAKDEWYRPPYFERYLKRRKWEDEPPMLQAVPRAIDRSSEVTDRKVAEYRRAQERTATPEEVSALLRGGNRG